MLLLTRVLVFDPNTYQFIMLHLLQQSCDLPGLLLLSLLGSLVNAS